MKKTRTAFTLAEALILLLIASLLAAALTPVITRKHREVGEHGKWICSMNDQGQHVVKTVYRGKISQFKVSNDADFCTFSPPPAAKNFTIKAVGGGGGGGGGSQGDMETIFDSRMGDDTTFANSIKNDGYYSIIAVGGGGGGGGMACGEAKDQVTAEAGNLDLNKVQIFLEQSKDHHLAGSTISAGNLNSRWHEDWSWDQKYQTYDVSKYNYTPCTATNPYNLDCTSQSAAKSEDPYNPKVYKYGYFDLPVSGFDYNLLFQNDKKFTNKYNYGQQNPEPKAQLTNEKGQFSGEYVSVYDFKYRYLPPDIGTESDLKNRAFCFAEKSWPMSKEIATKKYKGLYLGDMDSKKPNVKCWNLPGMGGSAGSQDSSLQSNPVFLKSGQSIYASIGQAGKGEQSLKDDKRVSLYVPDNSFSNLVLKTQYVYDGLDGRNGEETSINYGTKTLRVPGGAGGASRKLLPINFYINIPVQECEVVQKTDKYPDDYDCAVGEHLSPGQCKGVDDCTEHGPYTRCIDGETITYPCPTEEDPEKTCSYYKCYEYQDYWTCSTNYHIGAYYKKGLCVQRVRPKYFDSPSYGINSCVYSKAIPENHPAKSGADILGFNVTENFLTGLDYPFFNAPVQKYESTDTEDGQDFDIAAMFDRQRYKGEPGSGGYGAGEQVKSYIKTDDNVNSYGIFRGEDGVPGYVSIIKASAYGATGGQAGQYISTMVKKLDKLKVEIGHGGAPGSATMNGFKGGDTKIYKFNEEKPMFVLSGGIPGQAKKLFGASSTETISGGNGSPSPIENESNKAKVIPYGGATANNSNMMGQSAKIYGIWQNPTPEAMQTTGAVSFIFTGGHPLDMTYGAGGGGGAGGKTSAGAGGAGTPGVVIIEW